MGKGYGRGDPEFKKSEMLQRIGAIVLMGHGSSHWPDPPARSAGGSPERSTGSLRKFS